MKIGPQESEFTTTATTRPTCTTTATAAVAAAAAKAYCPFLFNRPFFGLIRDGGGTFDGPGVVPDHKLTTSKR